MKMQQHRFKRMRNCLFQKTISNKRRTMQQSLFISQVDYNTKACQTEHLISCTNLISHGTAWVSTVFKCIKSPPYFRVRTSQQQLPLTSAYLIPVARIDLFPRPLSRILRESMFTILLSICRCNFTEPIHSEMVEISFILYLFQIWNLI